jgi:glutamate carboxypeptidase
MRGFLAVAVALVALLPVAPVGAVGALSAEEIEIKVALSEQADEMAALLAEWVEINTGSWNRDGLVQFAERLREPLEAVGFRVQITPGVHLDVPGVESPRTGPLVLARRPARLAGAGPPLVVMLSGHFDTVFEPDSPFQHFARDAAQPERATGPGVADMKGGLVVMIYALRALAGSGDLDRASWVVVLNSDEEIGSLGSRPLIEREARHADYGFVFEAAQRGGAMVRSRRGLGQFWMSVEGVAAHSGSSHEKGRSAVRELAQKIVLVEDLTDYDRGITLNVGTVRGGTKRNIVPDEAEAWIDLRYDDPETGVEVRDELLRIADEVEVEGTRTSLWGRLHRPPKLPTERVEALLEAHADAAADLGWPVPAPVHAGGGTDGSLMGHVDLPTLDSMGVVGGRAHTREEYVHLESLPQRATLAAVLLSRLLRGRVTLGDRRAAEVD